MPRSKSVSGGRSWRRSEILPNSLSLPMATTSAVALPETTWVPRKTKFVRLASGVAAGSTATDFSAGNVSPVSVASSANRSRDSSRRQSPGAVAPAERSTTSPGTMLASGSSTCAPSRSTFAFTSTSESSFSTAPAAPRSCQKPSRPLASTIARMIIASTLSCRKTEMRAAATSIRTIGLENCPSNSVKVSVRFFGTSRLPSLRSRRACASAEGSPAAVVPSRCRACSVDRVQNGGAPGSPAELTSPAPWRAEPIRSSKPARAAAVRRAPSGGCAAAACRPRPVAA